MKIHVDFTLDVDPKHLAALRALTMSENNGDAATFIRGEAEDLIRGYMEDNGVPSRVIQRDGRPIDPPPDPATNPYADTSYWASKTGFLLHLYRWDRGDQEVGWCGVALIGVVTNTEGRKVCKRCLRNMRLAKEQ